MITRPKPTSLAIASTDRIADPEARILFDQMRRAVEDLSMRLPGATQSVAQVTIPVLARIQAKGMGKIQPYVKRLIFRNNQLVGVTTDFPAAVLDVGSVAASSSGTGTGTGGTTTINNDGGFYAVGMFYPSDAGA